MTRKTRLINDEPLSVSMEVSVSVQPQKSHLTNIRPADISGVCYS